MNNMDIEKDWNEMAQAYEEFTSGENSYSNKIEWRAIKTMLPNLKDKRVVDLGCGTGRFSFLLEEFQPKQIVGLDMSEAMIEIGKEIKNQRGSIVQFLHKNIEDIFEIQDNSFDFVFSSTTLHYIENLNVVMREIYKILAKEGTCILSVINPVYSACYPVIKEDGSFPKDEDWTIRYLDKSLRAYIQPWIEYNDKMKDSLSYSYHHTMADYINAIAKSGLVIEELVEPLPPEEWKTCNLDRYLGYINTPVYTVFKLKKCR